MSDETQPLDFGPLAGLIGTWRGDKGVDMAPESDGEERNLYFEELIFEEIGDVTNAESQVLTIIRYRQSVSRKSNQQEFHNQVGYWCWDAENQMVSHSFVIPRGVAVVAEGKWAGDLSQPIEINVSADPTLGVAETEFMNKQARTAGFRMQLSLDGDRLRYVQNTDLDIYGRQYDHKDVSSLTRVK